MFWGVLACHVGSEIRILGFHDPWQMLLDTDPSVQTQTFALLIDLI